VSAMNVLLEFQRLIVWKIRALQANSVVRLVVKPTSAVDAPLITWIKITRHFVVLLTVLRALTVPFMINLVV